MSTTTVNIEAFENLNRVILDAPLDRFDMAYFSEETACGTSHCAAGWAAVDPWFQENTPILKGFTPRGEDLMDSDEALRETFGISEEVSDSIFYACNDTKEEVLARIDGIIAGAGGTG
jgi:hypothetical protein